MSSPEEIEEEVFVRLVLSSSGEVEHFAEAAERRGAFGIYTSTRTVDASFERTPAALRFAVFAHSRASGGRIALHRGRFLAADTRGIGASHGPAHRTLVALADAARPGQILMSDPVFEAISSSGETAFDTNIRDLGRAVLRPNLPPLHLRGLTVDGDFAGPPPIGEAGFPHYPDDFVGRERELSTIASHLDHHRISTITGPPGAGKTRLAVEFGRRLRERHPDRDVWYVDLRRADTLEDVVAALAASLRIPLSPAASGEDRLVALGRALDGLDDTLIIVDGDEQTTGGVAVCLQTLLPMAPDVRWLVTAPHRLNLVPEREMLLAGLRPGSAVRLFQNRRQRGAHLDLSSSEIDAIAELAAVLGGSPLALRLTAGLAPYPKPLPTDRIDELVDATADPLDALVHAAIEDLDPASRSALRILAPVDAPIPYSFAVRAVDCDEPSLCELERRGLVAYTGYPRDFDEVYLDVPGAVRHAVANREGESAAPTTSPGALAESVGEWASEARTAVAGSEQPRTLDRVGCRRALLTRTVEDGDALDPAIRFEIAELLQHWYAKRGPKFPGRSLLTAILDDDTSLADARRAELLVRLATHRVAEGEISPALDDLADAEQLLDSAEGDLALLAKTLGLRHALERLADAPSEPTSGLLDRAEAAAEASDDDRAGALVALERAKTMRHRGDFEEAEIEIDGALELANRVDQPELLADVCRESAGLAAETFHLRRARRRIESAVEHLRALESETELAGALVEAATIEQDLDAPERAEQLLRDALRPARRCGGLERVADIQYRIGRLLAVELRFEEARGQLLEMLDSTEEYFWPHLRGPARSYLAVADAALGREESSRRAYERAATELENLEESDDAEAFSLLRRARTIAAVEHGREPPAALRPVQRALVDAARTPVDRTPQLYAIRLIDRYLGRAEAGGSNDSGASTRPTRPTLHHHVDEEWFRPPGGERVELAHRQAPRRIFRHLARHRRQFPGVPLAVDRLADIGWPNEELSLETGKNRVYGAIRSLRELGLRNVLETRDPGYLLSTDLAIYRLPADRP